MTLLDAVGRTLLLMRDEVGEGVDDSVLLHALTSTRVALIADEANLATHSAQTAYVTAAILMARSGHQVFLIAPNLPLVGPQPPLSPGLLIEQLVRIGRDLLPGVEFVAGGPGDEVDLAIALGDSPIEVRASRRIRLNAEPWAGLIAPEHQLLRWGTPWWPSAHWLREVSRRARHSRSPCASCFHSPLIPSTWPPCSRTRTN